MGLGAAAASPVKQGRRAMGGGGGDAVRTTQGLRRTAVNPPVKTAEAQKEDHAMMARGGLDNERQQRVFDPKVRCIGIDRQLLDTQVAERQQLRELEARKEAEYDKAAVQMNKQQQALQREVDQIRLQKEKDLTAYRATFQKKHASKEFALNDPQAKLKDLPARIGDDDPRCGPSSLQMFEGEDLAMPQRRKAQADQMKQWAQQQQDEKAMKQWLEDENNRKWEERAEEVNKKVWEVEQLQKAQKRQQVLTTADFNKKMAEQKRKEAAAARHQDTLNSLEEIQNQLDSDFLGESAAAAGTGRRERFKGLPPEHLQAIRNEQAQQQEELRQRRIREQEEALLDARRDAQVQQMSKLLEAKIEEEKRKMKLSVNEERIQQTLAQREMKASRTRLYAGEIGEQHFRKHLPSDYDECAKIGKPTR